MIDLECESCGKDMNDTPQSSATIDYEFDDGLVQVWVCISCIQSRTPGEIFERYKLRIKNGENVVYH